MSLLVGRGAWTRSLVYPWKPGGEGQPLVEEYFVVLMLRGNKEAGRRLGVKVGVT